MNPQPDTCAYGLWCPGTSCAEAPLVTASSCSNFSTVTTALAWNPATVTPRGAVTTVFAPRGANDTMVCSGGAPGAVTFTADLYSPVGAAFPVMIELVPSGTFNYVRTDGQIVSLGSGSIRPSSGYAAGLSNNNRNLRLVFTLCVASGVTSLRAGFYARNGNPVCATGSP